MSAPSSSIQQEPSSPMLDVHSSHAPVRGWRDFFIHIAIIVVGLCIAVGIQQTVEFIQHHFQRAEMRQALQLERGGNYKTFVANTTAWRWGIAELQNNLLVFQYLRDHPGTPQDKLPGVLLWKTNNYEFNSAAWDAIHQGGLVALLPRDEIEENSGVYSYLKKLNDVQLESARAIEEAERYNLSDSDPSRLSPAQVDTEIQLTQAALTSVFLRGVLLLNLQQAFPDFPATLTAQELLEIRHAPQPDTELLAPARALTMERMKAAGYVDSKSPPAQR
jgi:hypothetical protein